MQQVLQAAPSAPVNSDASIIACLGKAAATYAQNKQRGGANGKKGTRYEDFFIAHKRIGGGNSVSPKKGRIILNPGGFYGNEYASIPHFSIAKPESRHLQLFLPNHFHLGIELAVCIQELPLRQ